MLTSLGKYTITGQDNSFAIQNRVGDSPGKRQAASFKGKEILSTLVSGQQTNPNMTSPVIDQFIPKSNPAALRKIYRDIFSYDAIGGTAVELRSRLPYSDFTLSGISDPKVLKLYAESVERINVKTLFPAATIDHDVNGAFVGVMNFDQNKRIFTSIMPQDLDSCTITPVPIYGADPLIDLTISPEVQALLKKRDQRLAKLAGNIPDSLESARGGKIELQPESVLYIPRLTYSTSVLGTSFYQRLLPIYLIERALMRGTIDSVYRRQRGVVHISMGDGFEWIPSDAEMQDVVDAFGRAALDPISAIVATRDGVNVNELLQGQDFWKWEDSVSFFNDHKLKCLGLSEAFLSSDFSISTLDRTLSTFTEQLRDIRSMMTRKIFTQRVFPTIAIANNFKRAQATEIKSRLNKNGEYIASRFEGIYQVDGGYEVVCDGNANFRLSDYDMTQYEMPRISWHKTLSPEFDTDYIGMLKDLQEAGIPITIRKLMAAGGLDLNETLGSLEEDIRIRKVIDQWTKKQPKKPIEASVDDDLYDDLPASMKRDYTSLHEIESRDPDTGKKLSTKGRALLNEKANKKIGTWAAENARISNLKERRKQERLRVKAFSHRRALKAA